VTDHGWHDVLGRQNLLAATAAIKCLNTSDDTTVWESTTAGEIANGECRPGYVGSPQRVCSLSGNFGPVTGTPCTRGTCPAYASETSSYPTSTTGTVVMGTCAPGYAPRNNVAPTRTCQDDFSWSEETSGCDLLYCEEDTDSAQFATFPTSPANGQPQTGECLPGYGPTATLPQRTCELTGVWSATTGGCQGTLQLTV